MGTAAQLTVQDVVAMAPFQQGSPQLIAPDAAASTAVEVRWVHVTETADATGLLEGGEFVLSTARLLDPAVTADRIEAVAAAFLDGIEAAGAVALAVEVLADREPVGRALRAAAARRTLPVYLLTRQVRFVAITEEVHRRIAARQLEQLETDRRVHDVFTDLTLEAAPIPRIIAEAGRLLGAEVTWRTDAALALSGSEAEPGPDRGAREGMAVPVVTAGEPSGRLTVAVGDSGLAPSSTLQATVLERAAQAVALTLLAERSRQDQTRQAETALLHELRRPWNLDEDEALRRAQELGIGVVRGRAVDGPAPAAWLPVVVRWDVARAARASENPLDQQRRGRAVLDALAWSLTQARTTALAGRLQAEAVALLMPLAARALEGSVLERVLAGVERRLGAEVAITAGVGPAVPGLILAAARLDEADVVAEAAVAMHPDPRGEPPAEVPAGPTADPGYGIDDGRFAPAHRRLYFRAQDVRLRGLLCALRTDERLRVFARAELEPLLDPAHAADLALLEQFLAHGGNKSALAQTVHLSRPALYGRLDRLQRRLKVSLDDPESRTSLHVALLAYRLQRD